MTFYQELQLNSAASKELIRSSADRKEKRRHILVLAARVFLTLAFCITFITLFTHFFGAENGNAGVVVLLTVMVFRQADLGLKVKQGVPVMLLLFGILAVGPHLANLTGPWGTFLVNLVCILLLLVLGCHNIIMSNHATLVLGYILLYGNDVSGHSYRLRVMGLAAGGILTAAIYYRNHRHINYKRELTDFIREFHPFSFRTRWQLRMAFGVALSILAAQLLHVQRPMWVGFAAMSVLQPFFEDLKHRVKHRLPGTLAGGVLFMGLCALIPEELYGMIGLIGGACVGFCATYRWQTVFNSFGALAMAVSLYGVGGSVLIRYLTNLFGIAFAVLFFILFEKLAAFLMDRRQTTGHNRTFSGPEG